MDYHFVSATKSMSQGMRDNSKTKLTSKEISYLRELIREIKADAKIFMFNDEEHVEGSTCYDYVDDVVYVTRNVFPDLIYGSTHPRDIMSPRGCFGSRILWTPKTSRRISFRSRTDKS